MHSCAEQSTADTVTSLFDPFVRSICCMRLIRNYLGAWQQAVIVLYSSAFLPPPPSHSKFTSTKLRSLCCFCSVSLSLCRNLYTGYVHILFFICAKRLTYFTYLKGIQMSLTDTIPRQRWCDTHLQDPSSQPCVCSTSTNSNSLCN